MGPGGSISGPAICDDARDDVNPGETEVCDASDVDEDCNGSADDADPGVLASTQSTWYPDAGEDSYGDEDDAGTAYCDDPSTTGDEWTSDNTDCDDTSDDTFPGADEVCGDDEVNDCNGSAADALTECTWDEPTNGDANVTISFDSDARFTRSFTSGDFDGDGTDDIALGGGWATATVGTYSGSVFVLHGPVTSASPAYDGDTVVEATNSGDFVGGVVDTVPDLDGDGIDELLIGALGKSAAVSDSGSVYLVHGPMSNTDVESLATAEWGGSNQYDSLGSALAYVADVSGDGVDDFLLAGEGVDAGDTSSGAAYLVSGALTGLLDVETDAEAIIEGNGHNDYLGRGHSVAGAGDVDGDGVADVIVGSEGYGNGGAAFLFLGPLSGQYDVTDGDTNFYDGRYDLSTGHAVLGDFDWDNDGLDDIAVGAPHDDTSVTDGGALFVILGPATASGSPSGRAE